MVFLGIKAYLNVGLPRITGGTVPFIFRLGIFLKKTFHHFTIYLFIFYFKLDHIGHGIKGSQKVLCHVTISVRQANRFFQHICILYICIFQTQINALGSRFAVFCSSGTPAVRMKSSADIYITFTYCTQHQLAIAPHQPNHSTL